MEKFKSFQPIIIVILVCLSIYQFMQINEMKEDIKYLTSGLHSVENKLDKHSSSSIWPDIESLERRINIVESEVENQKRTVPFGWRYHENYNHLPPKRFRLANHRQLQSRYKMETKVTARFSNKT